MDFVSSEEHRVKIKESKNIDNFLDLARELKTKTKTKNQTKNGETRE